MMTETLTNLHVANNNNYNHYNYQHSNNNNNNNNGNSKQHHYNYHQARKSDPGVGILKNGSALTILGGGAGNNNHHQKSEFKRTASFITGQKLRESKWFDHDESRIFCAVVESGFVVEQKRVNGPEGSNYGVAIWTPNYEKSKNPDYLTIYMMNNDNGKYRILACKLDEFWPEGTKVRINNQSDKTQTPLNEETIRNQIYAAQHRKRKWHNTEHFAFFCRYGPVETIKFRKITDQLRLTTGTLLLKLRSLTAK